MGRRRRNVLGHKFLVLPHYPDAHFTHLPMASSACCRGKEVAGRERAQAYIYDVLGYVLCYLGQSTCQTLYCSEEETVPREANGHCSVIK